MAAKKRIIKTNRIVEPISNIIISYRDKNGLVTKEVDLQGLLRLINDPLIMVFTSIYWKGLEPKQEGRK